MRSRYAAFVVGDADYLLRTWHPATRPEDLRLDSVHEWTGLEVLATSAGQVDDSEGTVTYRASLRARDGRPGALLEDARFERRGRRWVDVDGDIRAGA